MLFQKYESARKQKSLKKTNKANVLCTGYWTEYNCVANNDSAVQKWWVYTKYKPFSDKKC